MSIKIGVLLDPYNEKEPGGLGRSIFELCKALIEVDTQNSYIVYVKKTLSQPLQFRGSHWSVVPLNVKRLWFAGGFGMDRTLDAYVFFTPVVPLFFKPKKSIVVALDFAYLSIPAQSIKDKLQAMLLYRIHKRSLTLATKIVAISEQTKQDTVRHFGIAPEKIVVRYIGYIEPSKEKKELPVPSKYFLFAGVLKERKNVVGIIRAFAEFSKHETEHHLLVAGKRDGSYAHSLLALVEGLGITNRVQFLGYVTNEQLAYLYSKATALVFPSLIEGFGMPALEAMSVGLPVITSDQGALAEVAGSAALLVDPYNPSGIAAAMNRIATEVNVGQELRIKGYERVQEFSWKKTAQGLVSDIEKL